MKYTLFALMAILLLSFAKTEKSSIYSYSAKTILGENFEFSDLKGKKILIVNTASKCGLTPQYEKLQKLYKTYGESNFVIIAFPSNDFAGQEPGSGEEIAEFCSVNYGVTFPVMEKVIVKGKNKHPVYQFLTEKELNGLEDSEVSWNFQKYLIDEKGELVKVLSPKTEPDDKQIIDWLEGKN